MPFGGRVRAMRGSERVVHVDVGQLRELLRERRIVLFFLGMEAQVFEQHHGRPCRPRRSPRVPASPTLSSANCTGRPSSCDSRSATGRSENSGFGLPFGRPRCDARITVAPLSSSVPDRRQRRPDARVVADHAVLDRHVEVDADEHPLALRVEIRDSFSTPLQSPSCSRNRSRSTQRLE